MVTLEDCPHLHPMVSGRRLDQEAVLVLADRGQVKVLNEVGARIWELIDGWRTVRQIAAVIGTEYDVDLSRAEADTLAFVDELYAKGIVVFADNAGKPVPS